MRLAAFAPFIVASAAACATASGPPAERNDRVIAVTETNVIRATELSTPTNLHVRLRPDSVFALLRKIYADVGVEVKLSDPSKGEFGNRNFSKYYNLKGVPLHNYVGCGTTATGPSADTYRVTMSLVSYVFADSSGSNVTTRLEAKADDTGLSKGMVSCLTTGALEERVNQLLQTRSGG